MNDRLKQLCEHSKAYATECTKHFTGDEPVVWMDYYTERFAQLIIKECTGIVTDAVDHREPASTYADRIQQHFDVE